jgi:hypothetical protein
MLVEKWSHPPLSPAPRAPSDILAPVWNHLAHGAKLKDKMPPPNGHFQNGDVQGLRQLSHHHGRTDRQRPVWRVRPRAGGTSERGRVPDRFLSQRETVRRFEVRCPICRSVKPLGFQRKLGRPAACQPSAKGSSISRSPNPPRVPASFARLRGKSARSSTRCLISSIFLGSPA